MRSKVDMWWYANIIESEYDYIEGDYIYTDGVYDDYYDGDYYIDGPNRGDQSLVSPEGNMFVNSCSYVSLNWPLISI